MKKAKLVNFVITARVVVDDNATIEKIADTALGKIYEDIRGYLTPECLEDVIDDTECPYKNDMEEVAPYFSYADEYDALSDEYVLLNELSDEEYGELNELLGKIYGTHVTYLADRDEYVVTNTDE